MISSFAIMASIGLIPKQDLTPSFVGSWIGTLEYRDYSDNSRQKLGTLLRIYKPKDGNGLVFRYVYDDGPKKVIQESETVQIDWTKKTYTVTSDDGKEVNRYEFKSAKSGELVLSGKGTENNKEVDVLTTIRFDPEHLKITRQTKSGGVPFMFRHEYSFTLVSRT